MAVEPTAPSADPVALALPAGSQVQPAPIHGFALVSGAETFDAAKLAAPTVARVEESVVTPEGAYIAMLRGNERFTAGITRGERRDEARRRSLASDQRPHTIVLSCSDSRVPPELIFDQGLGDLYTIRVSGNVLGSAQVASIETAIEKHGAKLIVVMGHESCDAVKLALGGVAHAKRAGSSTDQAWLASEIRPNVVGRGLASAGPLDPKLRQPAMSNVDAVTEQLLIRSKIVNAAVQSGKLRITRGIYSLDSGRVDFWGTR